MISVVCLSSLFFGNWPLKWDEKNEQFKINYCFIFTSLFVFSNCFYLLYTLSKYIIADESVNVNPQYLILYALYFNNCFLIINRYLYNIYETIHTHLSVNFFLSKSYYKLKRTVIIQIHLVCIVILFIENHEH